ncbi:MAG: hypothetical protein ACYSTT_00130 [Planctomycetota bacterium]|jgi:hypothetical protein
MDEKTEQLASMILSYLRRNPDAGDTLEGIAKWWLEVARIESSVDEVADTLESLAQKGIIRLRKLRNGTTFYKINKETKFTPFDEGIINFEISR